MKIRNKNTYCIFRGRFFAFLSVINDVFFQFTAWSSGVRRIRKKGRSGRWLAPVYNKVNSTQVFSLSFPSSLSSSPLLVVKFYFLCVCCLCVWSCPGETLTLRVHSLFFSRTKRKAFFPFLLFMVRRRERERNGTEWEPFLSSRVPSSSSLFLPSSLPSLFCPSIFASSNPLFFSVYVLRGQTQFNVLLTYNFFPYLLPPDACGDGGKSKNSDILRKKEKGSWFWRVILESLPSIKPGIRWVYNCDCSLCVWCVCVPCAGGSRFVIHIPYTLYNDDDGGAFPPGTHVIPLSDSGSTQLLLCTLCRLLCKKRVPFRSFRLLPVEWELFLSFLRSFFLFFFPSLSVCPSFSLLPASCFFGF